MVVKLSISIDDELAKLIKAEAKRTGRSVSEIFSRAIVCYGKEMAKKAYMQMASGKKIEIPEEAQLESFKKYL